jgi:branched-chain amino acid transport system substrate-binding protein
MRRSFHVGVAGIALCAALVAGCGSDDDGGSSGSGGSSSESGLTLRVGVPNALTGALAFAGVPEVNAAKLAAEHINAGNSKVHVELDATDYQSLPAKAVQVVSQQLGESSFNAFSGITSGGDAEAIKAIVAKDKRPFVLVQATSAGLTEGAENIWAMSPVLTKGVGIFIPFFKDHQINRVAMIWDKKLAPLVAQHDYLKEQLGSAGIELAADVAFTTDQTDFKSSVSTALAAKPQAVMVLDAGSGAAITRQLRDSGFDGEILGQNSFAGDTFAKTAGKAAANTYFVSFWTPDINRGKSAQFTADYTKKYGTGPDYFAANAYDAISFLAGAAAKAGSTEPDALREAMSNYGKIEGALGSYAFGPDRIPDLPFVLFQWSSDVKSTKVIDTLEQSAS